MNPKASLIIRTFNEERWIAHCLRMVFAQTEKNIEVIIVDSKSTDKTVEICKRFPVKIVTIEKYLPGLSLNQGIREATGDYIVCLSSHCIPKTETWLEKLLAGFDEDNDIAGVYGRQIPLRYSSAIDKRDLLITFGLDRRLQVKDAFFHNANSAIKRAVWDKCPFDEELTNIEDRKWAQDVIKSGFKLLYEPDAEVYHHHGIHHGTSEQRCRQTVKIMEDLHEDVLHDIPLTMRPENTNIVCFLPIIGDIVSVGRFNLLDRALDQIKNCSYIDDIVVVSENSKTIEYAEKIGLKSIVRGDELLVEGTSIETTMEFALNEYEQRFEIVDLVLFLNYLYPFRPENFFQNLIEECIHSGNETCISALKNYGMFWHRNNEELAPINDNFLPRDQKEPMYHGLWGLGGVTNADVVRSGQLLGQKIEMIELHDQSYSIKAEKPFWKDIAQYLLEKE